MTLRRMAEEQGRKPSWLKQRLPAGFISEEVSTLINNAKVHTVCQEAQCPNIWECFSRKTATFMIMGDHCTRNCRFCAVAHSPNRFPDPEEPVRIAGMVQTSKLDTRHVRVHGCASPFHSGDYVSGQRNKTPLTF